MNERASRTVYYCAATLDGFIAESDDTIDWLTGYEGSFESEDVTPIKGTYDEFYGGVGALVTGSATYEFVLEMTRNGTPWPYAGKPVWLLSAREWEQPDSAGVDIRPVSGDVSDLYDEMIASAGELDLWILGGGNVASQFADAGLLDLIHVTLVPVVLGEGKPLFERRLPGGPMQLLRVRPYDSGMVGLEYAVRR